MSQPSRSFCWQNLVFSLFCVFIEHLLYESYLYWSWSSDPFSRNWNPGSTSGCSVMWRLISNDWNLFASLRIQTLYVGVLFYYHFIGSLIDFDLFLTRLWVCLFSDVCVQKFPEQLTERHPNFRDDDRELQNASELDVWEPKTSICKNWAAEEEEEAEWEMLHKTASLSVFLLCTAIICSLFLQCNQLCKCHSSAAAPVVQ